jgi:hypothetical protein
MSLTTTTGQVTFGGISMLIQRFAIRR